MRTHSRFGAIVLILIGGIFLLINLGNKAFGNVGCPIPGAASPADVRPSGERR